MARNPRDYPDIMPSLESGRPMTRGEKLVSITVADHQFNYRQPGWWCSLDDPDDLDGQLVDEDNQVAAMARRTAQAIAEGEAFPPVIIRAVRRSCGLSQRDAGEVFGTGAKSFGKYETGEIRPSEPTRRLLRLAMKRPELFRYSEHGEVPPPGSDDAKLIRERLRENGTTSVSAMKTPYGTTQFGSASTDTSRYVQALDPLGYTERLEYDQTSSIPASESSVPNVSGLYNNELEYRNTFYWDKHAYAVSQGSYSAARVRHWAELATNPSVLSNFLESEKRPLENRVWYTYPGPQATAQVSGTLNKPTTIARVLDDGTTQATQFTYLCGNITGTGYTGPCGQLATHTDPAGRKTVLTYSANRIDLSSITQWNGSGYDTVAGFYGYDTHNRPAQIVDAAGQVTSLVYTSREQIRLITDPLGEKTTLTYDPTTARLTSVTNADGKVVSSRSYDAFGRVNTLIDSEGYQLGFLYDKLDRPTQTTFPDGSTRMFGYKMYDVASSTDRQNRTTSYQWDSDGNLNSVKDPLTNVTKFGYWENGALASIDDPNGNLTEFAIDVEGRTTGKEYADGSVIAYVYEATISRLHSITDALQQVKTIGYTVDNRPASYAYTSSSGTTPNVLFGYDPYYPRRTSMTDGNGLTSWSYEPVGTLGALKVAAESPPFANSQISYSYDKLSRMNSRSVGGDAETFGYDPIGRLVQHVDDLGTFKMTYLGETRQMTSRRNGVVGTTWTYDTNMNDRKLIAVANAPNGTTYQLTNNPEGAITQIIDSYNSQTLTLGYDSRDRLMSQSASSGNYAFNYDAADNITSFGKPNITLKVTPNNLNQIATFGGTSLSYYVTGNLAQDATSTYTWDAENRLVGIGYLNNQTLTSGFSYDGLNRRTGIAQSDSGVVTGTLYGWCGLRLCQARNGNSVPIKRYFAEGEATPGQNQYYYYGVDQVGSVRDVLDATSGALVAHYDYAPYGAALGMPTASATDFRYAGLFFHQRSGLYLSRTRALDPSDGHWESRDPLGEAGSINLYSYAGQDPIGIADPAGTGPINAVEDSPTYTSPVYYSSALGQESVWYPQTAESTPPPAVAAAAPAPATAANVSAVYGPEAEIYGTSCLVANRCADGRIAAAAYAATSAATELGFQSGSYLAGGSFNTGNIETAAKVGALAGGLSPTDAAVLADPEATLTAISGGFLAGLVAGAADQFASDIGSAMSGFFGSDGSGDPDADNTVGAFGGGP